MAAIWPNLRNAGARYLVLAHVLESRQSLEHYVSAVPNADISVVRLRASPTVLSQRIKNRESGAQLMWHLERAAYLADHMDRTRVEDILVETGERTPVEIAQEILLRAHWETSTMPT